MNNELYFIDTLLDITRSHLKFEEKIYSSYMIFPKIGEGYSSILFIKASAYATRRQMMLFTHKFAAN